MKLWNNPLLILLACGTIGLAPFAPEPHIWEKIRWIFGPDAPEGGWQFMHFVDIVLHGFPWLLLIRWIILVVVGKLPLIPKNQ